MPTLVVGMSFFIDDRSRMLIYYIDQLSQPSKIPAVEVENEARKVVQQRVVVFFGKRAAGDDFAFGENDGEIGVERFQQRFARRFPQPEDDLVAYIAHAVINAEEAEYLFDGLLDVLGDFIKRKILRRYHPLAEHLLFD